VKRAVDLLKVTFSEWNKHEAPRMGAALAFYSILSLAPLLILVVGVCALVFGTTAAQAQLLEQFRAMVGEEGARSIEVVLKSAQEPTTGVLASVVGLLTLLFGASAVFMELRATLNKLWEVNPADVASGIWSFMKDRFLSIGMVLAIGFLLLVSLAISAGLGAAGKFFASLGLLPPFLWEVVNFIISLGVVTGLFALIFRFVPNVRLPGRDILLGASFTAVLFTVGKTAIGIYLGKAGVGSAWGAAGSLVVLVAWIYYSAQIFFFGATFTRVYAQAGGWQAKSATHIAENASQPVKAPPRARVLDIASQVESPSALAKLVAARIVLATLFGKGRMK
jgi:membrane protein